MDHLDDPEYRHLSIQLELARTEKQRLLTLLRAQELLEDHIHEQAATAFPATTLSAACPQFGDLSLIQQHALHLVAHRGWVKRLPELVTTFQANAGVRMSEANFRNMFSRLRSINAVVRSAHRWTVHPDLVMQALEVLPPVPSKTGLGAVLGRLNAMREGRATTPSTLRLTPRLQDILDRIPVDRPIRTRDIEPRVGSRTGTSRLLCDLVATGLVVNPARGWFARTGVDFTPTPRMSLPPRMLAMLNVLPTQRAITMPEWSLLVASEPGGDGRYVVCGRTALLMRLGFVERIGRGYYRRKPGAGEGLQPGRKTPPPEVSELPKALAALLGHVPEGAARTLAELEAECAGDPELERGRLRGHVSRLLSRGLFVRVAPRPTVVHATGTATAWMRVCSFMCGRPRWSASPRSSSGQKGASPRRRCGD